MSTPFPNVRAGARRSTESHGRAAPPAPPSCAHQAVEPACGVDHVPDRGPRGAGGLEQPRASLDRPERQARARRTAVAEHTPGIGAAPPHRGRGGAGGPDPGRPPRLLGAARGRDHQRGRRERRRRRRRRRRRLGRLDWDALGRPRDRHRWLRRRRRDRRRRRNRRRRGQACEGIWFRIQTTTRVGAGVPDSWGQNRPTAARYCVVGRGETANEHDAVSPRSCSVKYSIQT